MPREKFYAQPGSVIRDAETIDQVLVAFFGTARRISMPASYRKEVMAMEATYKVKGAEISDQEKAAWAFELSKMLNDVAPPFVYFGRHHKRTTDWGWWGIERWEQVLREEGGIRVGSMEEIPASHIGMIAVIRDGSITLFKRGGNYIMKEMWMTKKENMR